MKQYYYVDNQMQIGPLSKSDLRGKQIKKDTLVWTEGLLDWEEAGKIPDLNDLFASMPPPIPKKVVEKEELINEKQDATQKIEKFEKSDEPVAVGVLSLVFFFLYIYFFNTIGDPIIYLVSSLMILVFRIFASIWATRIAFVLNRSLIFWGVITFIFPGISLIIIGLLNRRKFKVKINKSMPPSEQASMLFERSLRYFKYNRFSECVELLEKSAELGNNNPQNIRYLAISYYELNDFEKSKNLFKKLEDLGDYCSLSKNYLGKIAFKTNEKKLARKYWEESTTCGNLESKDLLERYFNLSNKFLLNSEQIYIKMGKNDLRQSTTKINYISGIDELDNIILNHPISLFYITSSRGICFRIEIEKKSSMFRNKEILFIGILFFEVDDIILDEKLLEVITRSTRIKFSFDCTNFLYEQSEIMRSYTNYKKSDVIF